MSRERLGFQRSPIRHWARRFRVKHHGEDTVQIQIPGPWVYRSKRESEWKRHKTFSSPKNQNRGCFWWSLILMPPKIVLCTRRVIVKHAFFRTYRIRIPDGFWGFMLHLRPSSRKFRISRHEETLHLHDRFRRDFWFPITPLRSRCGESNPGYGRVCTCWYI